MHVLGKVVRIMEVNQTLIVSIHNLLGQQHTLGQVLGDLAGHVVTLNGIDGRVLVGVLLLDLFVVALNQRQNLVVGRVLLALQALNIAIDDVMASDLVAVETHNLVLDQILNLLDRHGVARVLACLGDVLCRVNHLAVGKTRALLDLQVCGADGIDNLIDVKDNLGAAALDDLHPLASFASKSYCASEPNDARQGLPLSCGAVAQSVFSKTIGPHADNPRSQSRGSKIHPNGANKVLVLCPPSIIRQRGIYILYSFFRSNTTYSVSAGQSN